MSEPFPPIALRRCHAQTTRDSSSSYKIEYVIVMVILLKGWILPFGGASSVEGLRLTGLPRLVFTHLWQYFYRQQIFRHKPRQWSSCGINCRHSARQMDVLYSTEINFDHLVQQPYLFLIQSFILCDKYLQNNVPPTHMEKDGLMEAMLR